MLSGDEYLNAAQSNQLRLVRVEAPRGPILDRRGRVVVSNVAGTAVELWVGDMPNDGPLRARPAPRRVCSTSRRASSPARSTQRRLDPLTPIVVKTAVGEEQVDYLYEHQAEFPGVQIVQIYLRGYPYSIARRAGARLHGRDLARGAEAAPQDGYRAGDSIGKTGIEAAYDSYLRGRPGLGRSASTRSAGR